jgi:hypothetical protein
MAKAMVKNVRLSYVRLFEAQQVNGQGEIGREAAKRLIGSIEKPKTTLIERVVIEGILITGQSVGKIPEQK